MAAIEFTSRSGRTFTVTVRDPENGYASLASGIACTEITGNRYRASLGSLTGIVWIEAVAGTVREVGFADLDRPAANGFSELVDTQQSIVAKLDAIKGPGDKSWAISVRDQADVPISGVECWVAADNAGNNVLTDIQRTDANGNVEFLLDPGTYYLFRRKSGYTFNNPQSFTVT